ncbi:Helicase associated domain protein [Mycolicibacterium sp. 22603]|uniref:DEAD/DEAH box helicase n=1 Tax=Mycolicibacterium sp. 22603 TaxID=3453950 RepID=UPI003F839D1E
MGRFEQLLANLDPDPRIKGKQFEHVCKWFLENDPYYRDTVRSVWLWDDWEHRWGGDAGIDLVVKDNEGKFWAVQCKAYAPDRAVTKKDVDKFLSESSRRWFAYRLLIATTNRLHPIAQRTIDAQEKRVGFIGLADLLTAEADWAESPERLRPVKPPTPVQPHDYQKDAIRKIVSGFETADRGQLVMACGTGKTLTSLFIKEKLDARRTLVLLPSLSLLKQTMQVWRTNAKEPFEALPVCSDETVSQDDTAIAHISELCLPVKTDPAEIAEFLRRRSGPRVVFSTYQSSPQIKEAFALGQVPQFDLAIADESHRVAGDESTVFATILDADAIKARRRLFMTATPRYYTGRVIKSAQESEMEIASMDDPAKFGKVFHRLSFGEAIARGRLTDYQVAVVGVDDTTYHEWAETGVLVRRGEKTTDARTLASQIGLAKAMRKYDLHRVISFHSRVLRAKRFATELPDVLAWMPARQRPSGPLWTGSASGEMTAGERHVLLQRLRQLDEGERGVLTNARCLSEGVDVPTLDGVAFIDPRGSEVDIVQAVGRAIRLADDKTIGTIVIPVFIDTETDPATALNDSSFKSVWRVIKALRAHDEELAEQIDNFRRELGRKGGRARIPDKVHLNVSTEVGTDFATAFNIRLVEQTSSSWEYWFGMLERFVERHGHARVPQSHTVDGYRLGGWVGEQRTKYTDGTLTADRKRRLQELPGWAWEARAAQWEEGFSRLLQYVDQHGNARVSQSYTIESFKLGGWVQEQRTRYTEGILPAVREHRLLALPGWTWDARADDWDEGYCRLLQYVDQHGNARVPQSYRVEGYRLGQWVTVQRRSHAKRILDVDREGRLQALPGWTWDARADDWEKGFRRLLQYVDRHGHARVPRSWIQDGYRLGVWINVQRNNYSSGKLDIDRQGQLQTLPGWTWDARTERWNEGLRQLLDYVDSYGDARVPLDYNVDGFRLGQWVNVQRDRHAKGKLNNERSDQLEGLPGWAWKPLNAQWEEGFERLLAYVDTHGDACVPQSYVDDGFNLGNWVGLQRSRNSKGSLDPDRRQRLEDLPGWTWRAMNYDAAWEKGLRRLRNYIEHHGDSLVPQSHVVDGYRLGSWVTVQRHKRNKGTIEPERERRLDALPGWAWDARTAQWERAFARLLQYVDQHGNARVPQSYTVDDFKLGKWVNTQRVFRAKGALEPDRARLLQALPGWIWKAQ